MVDNVGDSHVCMIGSIITRGRVAAGVAGSRVIEEVALEMVEAYFFDAV
jgi:hypothetical protein